MRLGLAGALAVTALALSAASASADPYAPPAGQVYEGINDTASAQDFQDFAGLLGKPHLPIVQAFHTWGTDPQQALDRWKIYRARGVLSISTARGWGLPEVITPRQIAMGEGDDYLLSLNSRIARSSEITYIRPLAEPNNSHNAYSAVSLTGAAKGGDHTQAWYRLAWRRMYVIVKGGDTRAAIDQRLATLGLPAIQQTGKAVLPDALPAPQVAFIWCPIVYGSPNVRANRPQKYWPGPAYVDWVGTDTYSKYPAFRYLSRHYRTFGGKPFAIGEWGVEERDNPLFVKHLFRWQRKHRRVRMMIYHMSFVGRSGPLSLYRWPQSSAMARLQVRSPFAYPAYAPELAP
ncbi:MAG: hypothetical protein ABR536_00235 [Solirubrobacterales bacterium]